MRWFTDGERLYATQLWKRACYYLKAYEVHLDYEHRKVWREGLEVALKVKGSQARKRIEWAKTEHPFTAISARGEVDANHNEAHKACFKKTLQCLSSPDEYLC